MNRTIARDHVLHEFLRAKSAISSLCRVYRGRSKISRSDRSGYAQACSYSSKTPCIGNAAISVNLAYGEDIDRAGEVLKQIAAQMRREPVFKALMRGDLDLWGVDKGDGATVTIVGQIECTDSGRWPVQREFNRRMKMRFQKLGVDIAYPAQTRFIADEYLSRERRASAGDAAE